MIKPIQFYDIVTVPGETMSMNLWRIRYSLGLKGLPFETTWVEFPDIASVCKEKGIPPTSTGALSYTLPAIYDPNTSTAVADSALIVQYLDKTYPDTPQLFPAGSHALQYAFLDIFSEKIMPVWSFMLLPSVELLSPRSNEYFRRTREAMFGTSLEEVIPKGNEAIQQWAKVEAAFSQFDGWLEKGKANGPYFLGKEPAFVDIVVVSFLQGFWKVFGEDHEHTKSIATWNGGRWEKMLKEFKKYEVYT